MYQRFYDPLLIKIRRHLVPLVESSNQRAELTDAGKVRLCTHKVASSPWCHIKPARFRQCGIWQTWHELFPVVGGAPYIPSGCQACWKVVIRPANVAELLRLMSILRSSDLPCKCGMDLRTWTGHPWGGFIYADTQEQGHQYMEDIDDPIRCMISDRCADSVHLKRGCTEFDEIMPSDQWGMNEEMIRLETYLTDIFEPISDTYRDSEWIVAAKKQRWIEYANGIGDRSYQEIIGPVDLSVACVKYRRDNGEG
jgi:hypothetical protein